jgi:hypothetical protein
MANNKIHEIHASADSVPYWNERHVTRNALALRSLEIADAVILNEADLTKLRDVDMLQERDLSSVTKPIYLQFDGKKSEGRFIIGLLMSLSETDERVTVVPYSNNNDEGKMWPYDVYFEITKVCEKEATVTTHPFHPAALQDKMDEEAKAHFTALSGIALSFLTLLGTGALAIGPEKEDMSKLNKRRGKDGKPPVKADCQIVWNN